MVVDGLDCSGKSIVVNALREYFENKGLKSFDLREYWKKVNDIPSVGEVVEYDVLCSAEPTFGMVGKVIREEIVRDNQRKYSGMSTAHAFALDREILFKKLIIPSLKQGKIILQERGVVTSVVYQPIQLERISLRDILNIPGNRLAIQNAPNLLIITKGDPLVVMHRLKTRHKKDHAIFETIHFQRKIEARYESEWLKKLFENFGSEVVYLDTNPPKTEEDTEKAAVAVWEDFENSAKH